MQDVEIEAIIERAAAAAGAAGAKQALHEVGLHDLDAGGDIRELRSLLESWRTAKQAVVITFVKTITTAVLGLLAIGLWFEFGKK